MATSATPPIAVNCGRPAENWLGATVARGQSVCCVSFCLRACRCGNSRTGTSSISNFKASKVGRDSAKTWQKTGEGRLQTLLNAAGSRERIGWAPPVELSIAVDQVRLADLDIANNTCLFEANSLETNEWERTEEAKAIHEERLRASNAHGPDPAVLFSDNLRAPGSKFKFCNSLQNVAQAHDDVFEDTRAIVAMNETRNLFWTPAERREMVTQDRVIMQKVVGDQDQTEMEVKCRSCEEEGQNRSTELNNCRSHVYYYRSNTATEVLVGFWTGPEAEDGWGYVSAYVSAAEESPRSEGIAERLKSSRAFL